MASGHVHVQGGLRSPFLCRSEGNASQPMEVPISLPKAALPLSSSAVKRYEVSGHEIIHVQKEGSWLKFSFNSV